MAVGQLSLVDLDYDDLKFFEEDLFTEDVEWEETGKYPLIRSTHTLDSDFNLTMPYLFAKAVAERKVHHHAKIIRSLQDFAKFTMGLTNKAKAQDLPPPPSQAEIHSWSSWRTRSRDAMRRQIDDLEKENPNLSHTKLGRIKKLELAKLHQITVGITFQSPELNPNVPLELAVKKSTGT